MSWTPTPEAEVPPPDQLLALLPDNTSGDIGADDVRDIVQALASSVYWATQNAAPVSALDSVNIELYNLGVALGQLFVAHDSPALPPLWEAGVSYQPGQVVRGMGTYWVAEAATLAGDEPGLDPVWLTLLLGDLAIGLDEVTP